MKSINCFFLFRVTLAAAAAAAAATAATAATVKNLDTDFSLYSFLFLHTRLLSFFLSLTLLSRSCMHACSTQTARNDETLLVCHL
jgi:hypothetical protein